MMFPRKNPVAMVDSGCAARPLQAPAERPALPALKFQGKLVANEDQVFGISY
jgi:hypothetical protein